MHDWKKEFDEVYAVPSEITDRYEDWSWHNDSSPSFLIFQENEPKSETDEKGNVKVIANPEPYYYMCVWVEHPDPEQRVYFGTLDFPRFAIVIHGDCDGICLASSEELDDEFRNRLRIIEKYAKEHGLAHIVDNDGINWERPTCSCGNRSMASMGTDIICDKCHKYCGEIN